ncbi:hypothetical protein GCM10011351_19780 [Paraliobacillus quinghaiensis]|uniref:DUF4064 domain-containing protein n=1 Tax=Paraliobacillus quinghaiensis TaxID=470815 RepID=A0A917TQV1_9BACI|nr:DUF4064 domain-containing protein [Paraliobacillus quinghaiensis]GGM33869.1 hypothetical protein GCM10011351_19780 [Paraliobacillus quinghaiensis]
MKRTAEVVLGIIGTIIYGFFAIIGAGMLWMKNNSETVKEFYDDMVQQSPEMDMPDYQTFIDSMGTGGMMVLVVSLLAVILGIVAMVLLRGNKRPKVAAIIFVATAVIVVILLGYMGVFAGIFYIIAGILCLTRKPQQTLAE